jgi:hypothetical protein
LPGGPGGFPQGFSCPVVLGCLVSSPLPFAYRAFTFCGRPSHAVRLDTGFFTALQALQTCYQDPATPTSQRLQAVTRYRFGLFPVRSPLLGESLLFSFPPGTKMFQFPGCPPCLNRVSRHYSGRVAPFGYLRIIACLQLPEAFRRLPRPSSAFDPKASTVRPL